MKFTCKYTCDFHIRGGKGCGKGDLRRVGDFGIIPPLPSIICNSRNHSSLITTSSFPTSLSSLYMQFTCIRRHDPIFMPFSSPTPFPTKEGDEDRCYNSKIMSPSSPIPHYYPLYAIHMYKGF